MMLNEKLK